MEPGIKYNLTYSRIVIPILILPNISTKSFQGTWRFDRLFKLEYLKNNNHSIRRFLLKQYNFPIIKPKKTFDLLILHYIRYNATLISIQMCHNLNWLTSTTLGKLFGFKNVFVTFCFHFLLKNDTLILLCFHFWLFQKCVSPTFDCVKHVSFSNWKMKNSQCNFIYYLMLEPLWSKLN